MFFKHFNGCWTIWADTSATAWNQKGFFCRRQRRRRMGAAPEAPPQLSRPRHRRKKPLQHPGLKSWDARPQLAARLGEEGVIRRLCKQSLPFELRRCSVAFWQRCRHQDVDWEGCAEGSEAPCTQQDETKKFSEQSP